MKKTALILSILTLLISCNNEAEKTETPQPEGPQITVQPQEVPVNNPESFTGEEYLEYHENGQLKIKGMYDQNGERSGICTSFYDNGIKWSESYYTEGTLDGHSVTFFPNGKVRYIGEYKNGEKIGRWTFKDEAGNVVEEKNFSADNQ